MSSRLIVRSLQSAKFAPVVRPCTFGLRFNSSDSKLPSKNEEPSITSDFLLSLTKSEDKPVDQEAAEWIQAIKELRSEFTENGTSSFQPTKAFSPDGVTEVNLVQKASDLATETKFQPSEAQSIKAEQLKGVEIPVKTDTVINYLTNVIMRHGRKARAQRIMSEALYLVHLQTRQDPVALLKDTIEKMAPLLKLRRYTDGGARAEMIPVPLNERQRMKAAWTWIVDASDNRPSKSFSVRLAEEIVSASKGSGPGFEKKENVHKTGIAARSFINKL